MAGFLNEREKRSKQKTKKSYYERNREKIIEKVRQRQIERGEEFLQKCRQYYYDNREIIREKQAKYRLEQI